MKKKAQDLNKLINEVSQYFNMSGARELGPLLEQDTPEVINIPAAHFSGKRDLKKIKWIVIHCTESGSAKSTAGYFQMPQSTGSTQFVVGEDGIYRTLSDAVEPWAAPGANSDGLHIELAGYAKWSRTMWLSRQKTLRNAGIVIANWCNTYGIPKKFLYAPDLVANKKGITTHFEVSKAFKKSDHHDPGAEFPIDALFRFIL